MTAPGAFPAPPAQDPAAALHDDTVAALQRLHNHLAVHRPRALASFNGAAVDLAIHLMQQMTPERP
ncbi:hypothetical protein [Streptomyces sp. MH60]|uniref:hypothetical protein n=1 Tax=Streptomyces sp. MH60 TaxID=1940758 RepID=UPI000CEF0ADD|nr:hypothetical protein [Streptomyces sp. MH60]PPS89557.1 hypothetical protein BZZ08_01704 [Streptomyces sp. MH60]